MLSRGGSSVQHLVTDVHKGFPFQLFRCLAGPAAAAEVKDSRPCLRDPVAAWMLRNFPEPRDLCSDRAGLRHHVHRSEAQLQSSSAGPPECADLADGLCTSVGRLGCQAACAAQAEVFKRGARNREEENWPPGKDTLAQAWCGGPYRAFVHLNCKGKQLKLQGGWQRTAREYNATKLRGGFRARPLPRLHVELGPVAPNPKPLNPKPLNPKP